MIYELANRTLELQRTRLLTLRGAGGASIACERGLVWVTEEGEPDDRWLPSGETMIVARSGRVVIEAAQESRITIALPRAPRWRGFLSKLGWRAPEPSAC